jgi:hypothetical protein
MVRGNFEKKFLKNSRNAIPKFENSKNSRNGTGKFEK